MKDIIRINTVDSKYLNVSIKFTDEDENKAMQAFECHKSQLSPKEIEEWIEVEKKTLLIPFISVNLLYKKNKR